MTPPGPARPRPPRPCRGHLPALETGLFLGVLPARLQEGLRHLLGCADCRAALAAELRQAVPADPERGETLARMARLLAERLEGAAVPGRLRQELLARAWVSAGSARALRHDWPGADEAFARASRLLSDEAMPAAEAELCRHLAAGFEARHRRPEAAALRLRAALLAEQAGTVEAAIGDLGDLARLHLERLDADAADTAMAPTVGELAEAPGLSVATRAVLAALDCESRCAPALRSPTPS
jgi:hypothetical protein